VQKVFIWGDNDFQKHVHVVNWSTMKKPKRCGRLGILRLEEMNEACLLKLGWKLRRGSMVLKGKYDRSSLAMDEVIPKNNDSSLWKHLVQLWPNLTSMAFWVVRNGESVKAWDHCWVEEWLQIAELGINI
jgi:hypothetical protein